MVIGIIGAGNMGAAIAKGLLASQKYSGGDILAADIDEAKLSRLQNMGVSALSADMLAKRADIIIAAVKPDIILSVLKGVSQFCAGKIVISIAPGVTISALEGALGPAAKVVRVMPNTPISVREGMSAISAGALAGEADIAEVKAVFDALGRSVVLPESQFDAVVSVSGSSPAYVFMLIEAMADGAVLNGISRGDAYEMAAQAVLGSAKMLIESGAHPAALKDAVCSPGGTTIEAVRVLEESGFRAAVIDAMAACTKKSESLGKKE